MAIPKMLNLAGQLGRKKEASESRGARVKRSGSPIFHYSAGAIPATTGIEHLEVATATFVGYRAGVAKKYEPVDFIRVTNNSAENILIYINGKLVFQVPAGTIISNDLLGGIWFVALHNVDGTATSADEVKLELQRLPDSADMEARRNNF